MSSRVGLLPDILGWLEEGGVSDATADATVSSLNLVWIVSRFEDETGLSMADRLSELAGVRTVGDLAEELARMSEDFEA